jgi:hypothetical protein
MIKFLHLLSRDPVGQTIVFCGLSRWAGGPRKVMKNRQASVRQTIVMRRLSPARAVFSMVLPCPPADMDANENKRHGRWIFESAPDANHPSNRLKD